MSGENSAFEQLLLFCGPPAGEAGPERFVIHVLGAEPDEWQLLALRAFGRGERRISIRSCHGVGKTALLSWLVLYMLVFRFPQKTVATAPSKAQLEDALVSEVMTWFQRMPPSLQQLFECKKNRIELKRAPDASFFSARTARDENPEALQGVHSAHVLLIGDEASGIPEAIFEAAVGSMSGETATTVLAGNPVRTTGLFYDTHNRLKGNWRTLHVTGVKREQHNVEEHGYYSPRVSEDFVREVVDTYGENSNAHRIRALGEFPLGDLDTVIPIELIMSAHCRDIFVPPTAIDLWGLDVSRYGDDETVLVRRNRLAMSPLIESWQKMDTMQTAGRVVNTWHNTPLHQRPSEILIDVIGIGAGVVDRLRELNLPARGINVSETDGVNPQYRNLRTELWFKCRDWLSSRTALLPKQCTCKRCMGTVRDNHAAMLEVELAAQRMKYTSSGKIICYPKEEMKKKLKGRSPNIADALMLTFASEAASLSGASGSGGLSWNEPLRLNRQMV